VWPYDTDFHGTHSYSVNICGHVIHRLHASRNKHAENLGTILFTLFAGMWLSLHWFSLMSQLSSGITVWSSIPSFMWIVQICNLRSDIHLSAEENHDCHCANFQETRVGSTTSGEELYQISLKSDEFFVANTKSRTDGQRWSRRKASPPPTPTPTTFCKRRLKRQNKINLEARISVKWSCTHACFVWLNLDWS
jgi:hypothetical protein